MLITCLSVQGEEEEADWDLELLNEEDDGVVHWVCTSLPRQQLAATLTLPRSAMQSYTTARTYCRLQLASADGLFYLNVKTSQTMDLCLLFLVSFEV